jgi:hypothetical protein
MSFRWGETVFEMQLPKGLLFIPQIIHKNGAPVEWHWQGKTEGLGEKPVATPLRQTQISHRLNLAWTQASVVRGQRLTTWAMVRPEYRYYFLASIWFALASIHARCQTSSESHRKEQRNTKPMFRYTYLCRLWPVLKYGSSQYWNPLSVRTLWHYFALQLNVWIHTGYLGKWDAQICKYIKNTRVLPFLEEWRL